MIKRQLLATVHDELAHSPAVALLGPRQVGKTTLALQVAQERPSVYLDLQSEPDRAKLSSPELYLAQHADKLVVLDEIHALPGLFAALRGLIDGYRRGGQAFGHFLLLGSASMELMRQSGESLAGRIAYLELSPITAAETAPEPLDTLWLRGGFAPSLLAPSPARSLRWRQDFIRTYLERDVPQLGPRVAATTLRRFWTMLAHHQGGLLNAASLARSLGVDGKTVASYLDLMVDLLLVRRLPPWHSNAGKRLVKSPKVYVRDSGLLHALLGLQQHDDLLGHPVAGGSWEGFVIENILATLDQARREVQASFFRSAAGAEIDLLLTWPGGDTWALEIKRSTAPRLERGFHAACDVVRPVRRIVVYPGEEAFPLTAEVEALPLRDLLDGLAVGG
jgi:uncharacterized protein